MLPGFINSKLTKAFKTMEVWSTFTIPFSPELQAYPAKHREHAPLEVRNTNLKAVT